MLRLLFSLALILACVSWWKKDSLPSPNELTTELLNEPQQIPVNHQPFQTTVNAVEYTVTPLYAYDITGLVVSKHNSDSWWDWYHREYNDHLNVTDLCVIWGENARTGSYKDIQFSSGQWTCNFETQSHAAYAAFNQAAISNNHLLTAESSARKLLQNVRIGDQIQIQGFLSEYRHHHGAGYFRGTSTVRTDTGNGACETIFVTQARILRKAAGQWPMLMWLGLSIMLITLLVGLARPHRSRD